MIGPKKAHTAKLSWQMGAKLLPDTNYARRTDTTAYVNLHKPIPCLRLAEYQPMPPREFSIVEPDSPKSESEFDIAVSGGEVVELSVLSRFAMVDLRCVLFEMSVAII